MSCGTNAEAERIWRRINGTDVEGQAILNLDDVVEYKSSQGNWITAKVILIEPDRIQLDVKKGQWLFDRDIKDRLRTQSSDHIPCVIGSRLEGTKIQVVQIVENAGYLENTFPALVERFADVAEKGQVSWETFLELYEGKFAGKQAKKTPQQQSEKRWSASELREIFEKIGAGAGEITLKDVTDRKDYVMKEIPDLIAKWAEIDCSGDNKISYDEFRVFFGDVDDWLEHEFSKVIGLEDLKMQIRTFYRGVMLDKARIANGKEVQSGGKYHMIFQGNPGTGKTTVGRLIASILHRVEICPKDTLKEVQVDALVAEYVGQTAPKTQAVIKEATGGLLFVDEAYRLSRGGEKNSFGQEAIEQLMAAMNEPPSKAPIMVFAGYTHNMDHFMQQNDGLYRRIPYTFNFTDYSCSELAEILEVMTKKNGFELEPCLTNNARQMLSSIIEKETLPRSRKLMNGGICERIFSLAKQQLDLRDDKKNPSVMLTADDIHTACGLIPPPPGNDGGAGSTDAQQAEDDIRTQFARLQQELIKLRSEHVELKKNSTVAVSGDWSIDNLVNQVRELTAKLEESQKGNEELKRQLAAKSGGYSPQTTVASGAQFKADDSVHYFSNSMGKWIPAKVLDYNVKDGTYKLDVKPVVYPDQIRAPVPGSPRV